MSVEEATDALRARRPVTKVSREDYLSTGSTMLNLALSGKTRCGFAKGQYFFMVGDSMSGKTWQALSILAEAARNKHFNDYALVHDDVENGANMDLAYYFGQSLADRIEAPAYGEDNEPIYSDTVESMYYHIMDRLDQGPCIYITDSMDALSSKYEQERQDMRKEKHEQGKDAAGDYGDGKAKVNSSHLRALMPRLRETGSILIIVNQTRDNLGFGFEKKTRSGGHALRFYATLELWFSVKGKITKTVKGKKREMGVTTLCKVKKNRFTGRLNEVEIPIYHSYGIDDIGSMLTFLADEGRFTERNGVINAEDDLGIKGKREKVIKHIEEEGLERALRKMCQETWDAVADACVVERKPRYE